MHGLPVPSVTPSGGTGAATIIARSAQSQTEMDGMASRFGCVLCSVSGNPCEGEACRSHLHSKALLNRVGLSVSLACLGFWATERNLDSVSDLAEYFLI